MSDPMIQMLSDRMMSRRTSKESATPEEEMEYRKRVDRIVQLIKDLLNRYEVTSQVQIVEQLIHDCPNPGLRARYLDLLRPLMFETNCEKQLWDLLSTCIDDMIKHWDQSNQSIKNIDDLIENVELSVSALTMIQKWSLVKDGELPMIIRNRNMKDSLQGFHGALQQMLHRWSTDSVVAPPENHYRLFLLDSAAQNVLQVLNTSRGERRNLTTVASCN